MIADSTPDGRSPLRVLYVEDDPALRGIFATVLAARPQITIVAAVGRPEEALTLARDHECDVALLDLSLGADEITGIELGVRLRRIQPDVGIVLLSQYSIPDYITRVPAHLRRGWSFIAKRSDISPAYVIDVLEATARGLNILDPLVAEDDEARALRAVDELTPRQREVLSLVASGRDASGIAEELGLTVGAVRQELSKSYQVLVPDPPPGTDLRTSAVLRFIRETRGDQSRVEGG